MPCEGGTSATRLEARRPHRHEGKLVPELGAPGGRQASTTPSLRHILELRGSYGHGYFLADAGWPRTAALANVGQRSTPRAPARERPWSRRQLQRAGTGGPSGLLAPRRRTCPRMPAAPGRILFGYGLLAGQPESWRGARARPHPSRVWSPSRQRSWRDRCVRIGRPGRVSGCPGASRGWRCSWFGVGHGSLPDPAWGPALRRNLPAMVSCGCVRSPVARHSSRWPETPRSG